MDLRADAPPVRVVLLGDSHLARVRRDLSAVAPDVRNAAVGGATALDLLAQAADAAVGPDDVVVVSVGTNDASWEQVPLPDFTASVSRCLASVPARRWVHLAPPGVDESRPEGLRGRTNAVVARYREAAVAAFAEVGGGVVRTDHVIAPLGSDAFAADGLHLSGRAYRVVLPAIARAVRATA